MIGLVKAASRRRRSARRTASSSSGAGPLSITPYCGFPQSGTVRLLFAAPQSAMTLKSTKYSAPEKAA